MFKRFRASRQRSSGQTPSPFGDWLAPLGWPFVGSLLLLGLACGGGSYWLAPVLLQATTRAVTPLQVRPAAETQERSPLWFIRAELEPATSTTYVTVQWLDVPPTTVNLELPTTAIAVVEAAITRELELPLEVVQHHIRYQIRR